MYQIIFQVSSDDNSSVKKSFRFEDNKITYINNNYNCSLLVCQFLFKPLCTYPINFHGFTMSGSPVIKKEIEAQKTTAVF